ncbi:protein of unknown function [Legionella fallonii LLAP-10]|uniref:Uncharacterized protein n=1 Tax=Legionella fallonii LLAP-10 TaxID=1212491 RepID=A0A098G2W8_9GAMM|nr:protein of unknown function [Legionella fallonii LLAP-10]
MIPRYFFLSHAADLYRTAMLSDSVYDFFVEILFCMAGEQ